MDRTPAPPVVDSPAVHVAAPVVDTMLRLLDRTNWIASNGSMSPFNQERQDRGLGVFRITTEAEVLDDSLVFFSAPDASAPPIAVFGTDTAPEGWRISRFRAADTIDANIVEFRYETIGIPLDSVTPDGKWAHVIFGFAPGGRARAGWLPVPDSTRVEWWKDLLIEYEQMVVDSKMRFYERPDSTAPGKPLEWESYDIHSVAIEGDWMRVSIQVPGDYCDEPVKDPQKHVRWVRWRDAKRRPLLYYASRGC
jgi:hypothetical protein